MKIFLKGQQDNVLLLQLQRKLYNYAILQLNKGIPRVVQKLLKYFKGTILTCFVLPPAVVFPVILTLNMNDSDSAILSFGLSL